MVIFPSNTNNTFLLPQNDSVLCGSAENDQKRSSMSQCPGIKTPHGCTFLVLLHKWDGRWTQITDGCFRTQAGARWEIFTGSISLTLTACYSVLNTTLRFPPNQKYTIRPLTFVSLLSVLILLSLLYLICIQNLYL